MQQNSFSRNFRGMQVHAVPDSDKAFDSSGRKLLWAYDVDSSHAAGLENREPVEKGPFGRSQRRSRSGLSRSRSKTAEPRREEDRIKAEQIAAEDAVFGSLRRKGDEGRRDREALGEVDVNATVQQQQAGARDTVKGEVEAAEVLLYGFGEETQWAALDFYERVSGGSILEDYDRQPPGQRYDVSRSFSRATSQRSLTKAALKKKNTFAGGLHWIKVTFDSRSAADLAVAVSPHTIKGHLVYAEPYSGRGPGKDEAIVATQAGAQITDDVLPTSFSTKAVNPVLDGSPNGSSTTATSATATTRQQPEDTRQTSALSDPFTSRSRSMQSFTALTSQQSQSTSMQTQQSGGQDNNLTLRNRTRRISGATPATLLPASAALMPKQPRQSWGAWLARGEVIGSTVPKKEDGSFDYERASLYWRVFWIIDSWAGTDFCGSRQD